MFGQVYEQLPSSLGYLEIGVASWYGTKFHGRLTAMGETYDMHSMTAAHKALPLPTVVKVTNLDNGQHIVVRVNDRGPFFDDRLIDLSYGAAKALGFEQKGTVPVVVEALDHVNHPSLVAPPSQPHASSVYLQAGAFSIRDGAESRLQAVRQALADRAPSRVLDTVSGEAVLYKVWIGPVATAEESEQLALLLADAKLGNPIRVVVE